MHSHDAESACRISWASTSWSKSSSSSTSVRHEQGVTPFPLSQCWNMARQQASPVEWSALMSESFEPLSSKSSWSPRLSQNGATLSMILILILFPLVARSRDSFARVGVASKQYDRTMHEDKPDVWSLKTTNLMQGNHQQWKLVYPVLKQHLVKLEL